MCLERHAEPRLLNVSSCPLSSACPQTAWLTSGRSCFRGIYFFIPTGLVLMDGRVGGRGCRKGRLSIGKFCLYENKKKAIKIFIKKNFKSLLSFEAQNTGSGFWPKPDPHPYWNHTIINSLMVACSSGCDVRMQSIFLGFSECFSVLRS